jgi:hypothetical protein
VSGLAIAEGATRPIRDPEHESAGAIARQTTGVYADVPEYGAKLRARLRQPPRSWRARNLPRSIA